VVGQGSSFSYTFPQRGVNIITAEVVYESNRETQTYSINIEEVEFSKYIKPSYSFFDNIILRTTNLSLAGAEEVIIKINQRATPTEQISSSTYSAPVIQGLFDIGVNEIELEIDGSIYPFSLSVSEPDYSNTPREDAQELLESMMALSKSVLLEQGIDEVTADTQLQEIEDLMNQHLAQTSDDQLKFIEKALRVSYLNLVGSLPKNVYQRVKGLIMESILDLIPTAHANDFDSEANFELARNCSADASYEKIQQVNFEILSRSNLLQSLFAGALLTSFLEGPALALFLAGLSAVLTVDSIVGTINKLLSYNSIKDILRSCLGTLRFPLVDNRLAPRLTFERYPIRNGYTQLLNSRFESDKDFYLTIDYGNISNPEIRLEGELVLDLLNSRDAFSNTAIDTQVLKLMSTRESLNSLYETIQAGATSLTSSQIPKALSIISGVTTIVTSLVDNLALYSLADVFDNITEIPSLVESARQRKNFSLLSQSKNASIGYERGQLSVYGQGLSVDGAVFQSINKLFFVGGETGLGDFRIPILRWPEPQPKIFSQCKDAKLRRFGQGYLDISRTAAIDGNVEIGSFTFICGSSKISNFKWGEDNKVRINNSTIENSTINGSAINIVDSIVADQSSIGGCSYISKSSISDSRINASSLQSSIMSRSTVSRSSTGSCKPERLRVSNAKLLEGTRVESDTSQSKFISGISDSELVLYSASIKNTSIQGGGVISPEGFKKYDIPILDTDGLPTGESDNIVADYHIEDSSIRIQTMAFTRDFYIKSSILHTDSYSNVFRINRGPLLLNVDFQLLKQAAAFQEISGKDTDIRNTSFSGINLKVTDKVTIKDSLIQGGGLASSYPFIEGNNAVGKNLDIDNCSVVIVNSALRTFTCRNSRLQSNAINFGASVSNSDVLARVNGTGATISNSTISAPNALIRSSSGSTILGESSFSIGRSGSYCTSLRLGGWDCIFNP